MKRHEKATRRVALTERRIRDIDLPDAGRAWVYDSASPLAVMLTAAGSRTFYVYRRVMGRPQRVRLGAWPGLTLDAARKIAAATVADIANEIDPNAKRKDGRERARLARQAEREAARVAAYTFDAAVNDYIDARRAKLKERTIKEYRRIADTSLRRLLDVPLNKVTGDVLLELHRDLAAASGRATANAAARVSRAVFRYAAKRGRVERSPLGAMAGEIGAVKPRKSHVAEADLGRFLLALDEARADTLTHGVRVAADALLLLTLYGLRRGEALRLKVGDVDLARRTFVVRETKNDDPLTLPITDVALPLFRRRLADAASVGGEHLHPAVTRPSGSGAISEVRNAVAVVERTTGLTFMPHDLRRTFASVAARHLPHALLKATMNHRAKAKGDITLDYVVVTVEDIRRPLGDLHDHLWSLKARASGLKLAGGGDVSAAAG